MPKWRLGSTAALLSPEVSGIQERDVSFHSLNFGRRKKKKAFWSQFHCSRNNYMTMHSKNSIILAGYFDWEVWHWQRPPPTELLMPRSCVDKQSPGATSPARVSSSFSLIRHCWRLCSACFHPLINTARSTSIIYIMQQVHKTKTFKENWDKTGWFDAIRYLFSQV